ncbi:MAG: isorenieratene synthase, partial [Saccharothrix sp.]|nr:isorenieratene synthase [Saccharothrix sp.]
GLPRAVPWNAAAFLLRSPAFAWRDLPAVDVRAALPLLDVSVPRTYLELDHLDAAAYLDRVRFPRAAHAVAFEVFSRSFFADPARLSAAELATMFHIYFLGSGEGLLFDVAADPFPHALWHPLARHLDRLGVIVRTGSPVLRVDPGFRVHLPDAVLEADAVVLALDVAGLRSLVASSPLGTPAWRADIAGLECAPPFLVSRYWLDRPVRPDRPGFLGTSGYDLLDNVSVLDRYDREAAAWAGRVGGAVVELHGYALPSDVDGAAARVRLLEQLRVVYPETRSARVVDARHELRADCPLFPPGGFARRPAVRTPVDGLVLAGDLVRVDLPVALMERAATTGFAAANHLLSRWGVAGTDLWSVPTSGRGPLLRALARRFAYRPAVRSA